jgi:hypothetical protein
MKNFSQVGYGVDLRETLLCIGGYEKFFSSRLWSDLRETLLSRVAYGEKKIFFGGVMVLYLSLYHLWGKFFFLL